MINTWFDQEINSEIHWQLQTWSDVTVSTQKSEPETYPELQIWSDPHKSAIRFIKFKAQKLTLDETQKLKLRESESQNKTHLDSPTRKTLETTTVFSNTVSI